MRSSRARDKYFQYLESKGKIPSSGEPQEHEEESFDYEEGHASEYDSSGEPHTEGEREDKHPMEFMSRGGRVKPMARGGFAQALRKARY